MPARSAMMGCRWPMLTVMGVSSEVGGTCSPLPNGRGAGVRDRSRDRRAGSAGYARPSPGRASGATRPLAFGRGWLALDLREIRHRARCGTQRVEELEAVLTQGGIVGVDRHLVEEGVDRRAQAREGEHGAFEVLLRQGLARGLALGDERFPQLQLLGLAQEMD